MDPLELAPNGGAIVPSTEAGLSAQVRLVFAEGVQHVHATMLYAHERSMMKKEG